MFSARSDKQDEEDQVLDEIEFQNIIHFSENLTEPDIVNIDVGSQLKEQIQNQEKKGSRSRFDRFISMTI